MSEEEFAACMEQVARGDKQALREIYEAYLPYLYTVVYGVLQNREAAEDVSTDAFLRLWETAGRYRAGRYRAGRGHKAYLATIARNMAIDELRRRRREVLTEDFAEAAGEGARLVQREEDDGGGAAVSGGTDSGGSEEQIIGQLTAREALARLKPEEREIVDMKILSEMTFREIAEALGLPMGTVTWRYREAIEKLRRCGYEQT